MNKQFSHLIVLISYLCLVPAIVRSECDNFERALQLTTEIRQLPFLNKVTCTKLSHDQLIQTLRDRISTQIQPEKIRYEGLVYKILGFIPQDYDYERCIIENYLINSGAFFRAERNDYVVIDGLDIDLSNGVHELTHALQSQHFNVNTILNIKTETSDALMAKFALIEGDAVVVEESLTTERIRIPANKNTKSKSTPENMPKFTCKQLVQLEDMMNFPYQEGANFIRKLKERGGYKLVNSAFNKPPESTSEILDPDKYLDRLSSSQAELSFKLPLTGSGVIFSDQMGQYFIKLLVTHHFPYIRGAEFLDQWMGDRLTLSEPSDRGFQLNWEVVWRNSASAARFGKFLKDIYIKRLPQPNLEAKDNAYLVSDKTFGMIDIQFKSERTFVKIDYYKSN